MKVKNLNSTILMKDAIDLISGRDLPKHQYNDSGIGIPYIMGASNIKNGQFEIERWTDAPTVIGKKGDIVLSVKGTVGQHFILNEEEVHLSRQVMALRVKEGFLNEYINFFLQYYINKLSSKAKGMIPGITREDILFIEVPNFDLERQLAVINVLKKASSLINKRKAQIEALNQLTQSVFLEMFGDPVINKNKHHVHKLSDLCFKITDGTHHSPPMVSKGIPYITAKHLGKGYLDFYSDPTYVSDEDHQKIYSRCNPEKGDVLYIKDGATTGIAAINHYDFEFSMLSSLALIKVDPSKLNNHYLVHYLNNKGIYNKITSNMSGGAIKRLTVKKINNIDVVTPPIHLQDRFAEFIVKIEQKKSLLEKGLKELENNYYSIMQRAFKGELFNEEG